MFLQKIKIFISGQELPFQNFLFPEGLQFEDYDCEVVSTIKFIKLHRFILISFINNHKSLIHY